MTRFFGKHTIQDDAATPYMTRIWFGRLRLHIFYRGDSDPDPHDHPWGFWTFPLTSYVEEVAKPVSKGLTYMEALFCGPEKYFLERQLVRAFRLHYRPANHTHRVLGRYAPQAQHFPFRKGLEPFYPGDGTLNVGPAQGPGKIITLVWRGKETREWGFLKNRDGKWCWTDWKEYVFNGGKHAPCEEPNDH